MKFSETNDFFAPKGINWTLEMECVEKILCNIKIMAKGTNPQNSSKIELRLRLKLKENLCLIIAFHENFVWSNSLGIKDEFSLSDIFTLYPALYLTCTGTNWRRTSSFIMLVLLGAYQRKRFSKEFCQISFGVLLICAISFFISLLKY